MTTPLAGWPLKAYTLAKEKGWHPDGEDPMAPELIGSRVAMILCEIAEAIECVSRGRMKVRLVTDSSWAIKPEGFPIEIADVFLRLADFAYEQFVSFPTEAHIGRLTPRWSEPRVKAYNLAALAAGFSSRIVCGRVPRAADAIPLALTCLFEIAAAEGFDLLAMAELKHTYNTTRTLRHGGKVL